jgi:endonuclease/exonuclease/phosphatase family metal-dependent hydrolase
MPFCVASYNVLADVHIKPNYYDGVPPELLDPAWRRPALAAHIAGLGADVLCLQEVEPELFDSLQAVLGPLGFAGRFAPKLRGKPEGCATFVQSRTWTIEAHAAPAYRDGAGGPDSGHVSLLLELRGESRLLGVCNTHLKWGPADAAPEAGWADRQIGELLDSGALGRAGGREWVLCGDFNVTPDVPVLERLRRAGFADAHGGAGATSNFQGRCRKLDYVLHTPGLAARPVPPPALEGRPPLPWPDQPSDHLPSVAWFD